VLRALPRYRDRGTPVRHWVFRIANHSANRWLRRRRSEVVALAARADVLRLQADGKEAERAAAAREVARQALAALPRKLQEVAALHYLAELPLDEVAATLRIPLGTVKSRLSRALDRLRSRLPEASL